MEDTSKNVMPKVTVEEFNSSPETIEVTCRSGWENIKAQDNEDGLEDYAHVKLNKGYVTYKIVGAHCNDIGQVSLSLRKIKATQVVVDPKVAEENAVRRSQICNQISELQNELESIQ